MKKSLYLHLADLVSVLNLLKSTQLAGSPMDILSLTESSDLFHVTISTEKMTVASYKARLMIDGYKKLHKKAGDEQKSIYDVMDTEVSEREAKDKTMKSKLALYARKEL